MIAPNAGHRKFRDNSDDGIDLTEYDKENEKKSYFSERVIYTLVPGIIIFHVVLIMIIIRICSSFWF